MTTRLEQTERNLKARLAKLEEEKAGSKKKKRKSLEREARKVRWLLTHRWFEGDPPGYEDAMQGLPRSNLAKEYRKGVSAKKYAKHLKGVLSNMPAVVTISLKDRVGVQCVLLAPEGQKMSELFWAWKKQVMEGFLAEHPELWDAECDEIVKNGHSRDSLLEEVVRDADGYPYGMYHQQVEPFVAWLLAEKGFKKIDAVNFHVG